MTPRRIRRVAIYARLSVSTEESVSIERQLDSARKYAEARGWEVVVEANDDGVSAMKNRPEDRVGWRTILDSPKLFEAVVVWKVDRLARRVLDFLHADEALQARGAGIVAVEDPVDMTTPQGRAFATMLAVFGEMEAAAISARVSAARRAIVHAGRRTGGRPPFGWMNVPNPDGPGMVLAKDPERIGVVEALARRALAGDSVYSLTRWLEDNGVAPRDRKRKPGRKSDRLWHEASVEAILRAPALAGMTPYTPGRKAGDNAARVDVLRDADGLPLVDESIAIITPDERRRLLAALDARKAPGTRVYSSGGLLSGLLYCDSCDGPLHRATGNGYAYYRCPKRVGAKADGRCPAPVSVPREAVERVVVDRFLGAVGRFPVVRFEEAEGASLAPRLAEIEAAIADTLAAMTDDDADLDALTSRLASLKDLRAEARAQADAAPGVRPVRTGETFAEAWAAAEDDRARRDLLASGLEEIVVTPGGGKGRAFDPDRLILHWREAGVDPDDVEANSPGPHVGRSGDAARKPMKGAAARR